MRGVYGDYVVISCFPTLEILKSRSPESHLELLQNPYALSCVGVGAEHVV